MELLKSFLRYCHSLIFAIAFLACSNNDPSPVALEPIAYKNLNADYAPVVLDAGLATRPKQTNKFTFFSFRTGTLVANADSATTKWDIGFRGTTIIVNGGSSGKGGGKVQVVDGLFDELTAAPLDGYVVDNQKDNKNPVATSYAIKASSGMGWYNEDQVTKLILPIEARFFVFQLADGRYAKMEVKSYYKDAPVTPIAASLDRYYTFKYIYQPNGSVDF
jgi:hypothetical protein